MDRGASTRPLLAVRVSGQDADVIEMDGLSFHHEASTEPLLAEGDQDGDASDSKADGYQQDYEGLV